MAIHEVGVSGLEYLALATELLPEGFEPMGVEDAYQQRGPARAMLTAGLDRLAKRGARRLKVGYATEVARRLYVGAGFRVTSTSRSYRRRRPEPC